MMEKNASQTSLATANATISRLEAESANLQTEKATFEAKAKDLTQKLLKLNNSQSAFIQENGRLKQQINSLNAEMNQLRTRLRMHGIV